MRSTGMGREVVSGRCSWMYLASVCLMCVALTSPVAAFEPFSATVTMGAAVLGSGVYAGWTWIKCRHFECCHTMNSDKGWIKYKAEDFARLEAELASSLYGQPLVRQLLVKALRRHVQDENPVKALSMSFHGWTGGGKNYASILVAKGLYKKGMDSTFVHLLSSTSLFSDSNQLPKYKAYIKNKIETEVKKCGRQLFIFDEVDKMPQGLMDAVAPYLEYNPYVDGVDYRKCIFIFLSNTGGTAITKISYDFWVNGKDRADIKLKNIEPLINEGAFNERGGLRQSTIIEKNLIDFYVPFLPLEKKHVKLCISDHMKSKYPTKKITSEFLEKVASEMEYFPPDVNLYSKTGCKRVQKKVDVLIDDL